jgi:deoxyribodipyrimidine photo-lyase
MTLSPPTLVWFREDLRLNDNPALAAAAGAGGPVVCVYIRETELAGARAMGGASKWWLDKSLKALAAALEARGGRLVLRTGPAETVIRSMAAETGARSLVWNRRYGEPEKSHDATLKAALKAAGLTVQSFNARLLMEPWELKTGSGGYYRVFTPFWRALRANYVPPPALPAPPHVETIKVESEALEDWRLHPSAPDWSTGFTDSWTPGEQGAQARLAAFLEGPVNGYAETRNRPDIATSTSRLSPHLRFGEIGPAQIWRAVTAGIAAGRIDERNGEVFLSEIAWR